MIAWILRFVFNTRNPINKRKGALTEEEIGKAETFVVKRVQRDSLDENDKRWRNLQSFRDENGVIRVKSRVLRRNDAEHFRLPILLPANHPVVINLIFDAHVRTCHVGTQGLMSILRNNYWILGGRRPVRSAIAKCVVCKRHNRKPFVTDNAPLPLDRVRDAGVFEIVGIDFAGPLFLKTGEKAWICLFTCAIYRAVHLELCTSLTVAGFVQALRRFIARRGRPRTIYTDNGTNFVGTENAFQKIDWQKITEHSSAERITWRFNPPSAPWWGGFWERLIGVLKQLLRKVLGRACLNYEELLTVLCDCESVVNSRPLTYMSNDAGELLHLTPNTFLREQVYSGVPDCDEVDSQLLCRKVAYQRKLREDLRRRFRDEYLGQLDLLQKKRYGRPIRVGELVLIGNDKRLDWPLGRVTELLPGPDGQIRLIRVTTARGSCFGLYSASTLWSVQARQTMQRSRVLIRWTTSARLHRRRETSKMIITLGVGVGGHGIPEVEGKPYKNQDAKEMLNFYLNKNTYLQSWQEGNDLKVDYVKVYAL
nr:uncharacterized protein LOC111419719 [Onthophagus taurus]